MLFRSVDGQPIAEDLFEEKSPAFSSKLIEEGHYFVAGVTCDEIANIPSVRYKLEMSFIKSPSMSQMELILNCTHIANVILRAK